MDISHFRLLPVAIAAALFAQTAGATTITNGDFESGLTGYTTTSTEVATIGTSGANDFLSLEARGLSGVSSVVVSQQVTIDAAHAILTFDAAVLSETLTGVSNPSIVPDLLQVAIGTDDPGFTTIFQIDSASDANSFLTDLAQHPTVTAGDASVFGNPISVFSVAADLSGFAGQTLDLRFGALNFDAFEKTTFFGLDNFTFENTAPAMTPVPLPATAWLLLAGCCALLRFRRPAA